MIMGVWLNVCSLTGAAFIHSSVVEFLFCLMVFREFVDPSQTSHTSIITAKNEMREPREDKIFQDVNVSG